MAGALVLCRPGIRCRFLLTLIFALPNFLYFALGFGLCLLDIYWRYLPCLLLRTVRFGRHASALDYLTSLAPPLNPLRLSSNSYYCPSKHPYLRAGSGLHLLDVLLALFALNVAENGEFGFAPPRIPLPPESGTGSL